MAADFGLSMYDEDALRDMFDQLRTLRVAAGDFPGSAMRQDEEHGGLL
jgi:hypothetical protein